MRDSVVRAQVSGGKWETLGADSARGIVVENLTADIDDWGPRAASFVLRRKTDVPWPDIAAFAPLEIESQGLPVWSGRVKGTPTTDDADRRITVNAEGWQYHTDDDVYERRYVHSKLTDFVDARSLLSAPLGGAALFCQAGQVQVSDGVITLGFQNGVPVPAGAFVGVTLDFGAARCSSLAVNWENSNNAAPIFFYCSGNDAPDGGYLNVDPAFAFPVGVPTPTAAFNTATFTQPRRYVNLFLNWPAGGTPAAEIWVKIIPPTSFFADAAYVSGGYSVLKASDVVLDAKSKATLLLSTDTSKVQATSFSVPDFSLSGSATPREAMNAINAYHKWQLRVDAARRLEYRPLPTTPILQVDARSKFDEASAGDADEVYSDVVVLYTDPAGQQQLLRRSQPASLYLASAIQMTNPGFETNTASWSGYLGTFARDTVVFNTGVASLKITPSGGLGNAETSAWTGGTFVPGRLYSLSFAVRTDYAAVGRWNLTLRDANGTSIGVANLNTIASTWQTVTIPFTPQTAGSPLFSAVISGISPSSFGWIDSFTLSEASVTIVDRRGFRRSKVLDTSMALTGAGAQQIGDVFLTGHKTTPLKGKLVVTGYGTASHARSGQSMPTAELLTAGGELVRLAHLIDPDTGAIGREGRIASVSWDADSDTATIEIDSQSTNFEAMLSRLALVTGQVP